MIEAVSRDAILLAGEDELSGKCRITFTKGSGPGGQKRNKTSSAVRVELPGFNAVATDCTERSQFRNRSNALRKLKMQIAFNHRNLPAVPPSSMTCAVTSPNYPFFAAHLLDVLEENSFDHRKSAAACQISPSALLKKIHRDPDFWVLFQKRRKDAGLPALHLPE